MRAGVYHLRTRRQSAVFVANSRLFVVKVSTASGGLRAPLSRWSTAERLVDLAYEAGPLEHEGAVDLHEGCALAERPDSVVRRADATAGNKDTAPGAAFADPACALAKRRAGDASIAPRLDAGAELGRDERAVDGRVCRDDAVRAGGERGLHGRLGLVVRRDLHEHGPDPVLEHRLQDARDRLGCLEATQAGRVGTGDVEHRVVGERREPPVGDRVVRLVAVPVLPHVDADRETLRATLEPPRDGLHAVAVEAHPVQDQPGLGEAEKTGPRISRLRARRHRADLGEAEA